MRKPRLTQRLKRPKRIASPDRLDRAVRILTKDALVEFVLELARNDSKFKRRLEAKFVSAPTGEDLINQTAAAIAHATDFDDREINRNFDYDGEAYALVQRNFARLIKSGRLAETMGLAIELMDQGSYQVEMSDEGLMAHEIEECLCVVIEGVRKSGISKESMRKWCLEMIAKDHVGCICRVELRALHDRPGDSRSG